MRRVAVDSNVFIYALSGHPQWGESAKQLLIAFGEYRCGGVASVLCLTEVVTGAALAYPETGVDAQMFMEALQGVDYVPIDIEIAIQAAYLRAKFGPKLKTPDSLHLATAVIQKDLIYRVNYFFLKSPKYFIQSRLCSRVNQYLQYRLADTYLAFAGAIA